MPYARPDPDWRERQQRARLAQTNGEAGKVIAWRLEQLLDAGYPVELAEPLAAATRIDLHHALALLTSGCPPRLAADILL